MSFHTDFAQIIEVHLNALQRKIHDKECIRVIETGCLGCIDNPIMVTVGRAWETWMQCHGPLTRFVKLRVVYAPGMPRTFSRHQLQMKPIVSERSRCVARHVRHARSVMHIRVANPRWWGKRSRHSRRMRNPQSYVSGKRPICGVLQAGPL